MATSFVYPCTGVEERLNAPQYGGLLLPLLLIEENITINSALRARLSLSRHLTRYCKRGILDGS